MRTKPRTAKILVKHASQLDAWLIEADRLIKILSSTAVSTRPSPADLLANDAPLEPKERRRTVGFVRVNHTGEICAQALYRGQALTAKIPEHKALLQQAAQEEEDHLAWCEKRIAELDDRPSYLNPLWYFASFALGAFVGLKKPTVGLGFVEETEQQVTRHLEKHLADLSPKDQKTRAIFEQMRLDELKHSQTAAAAGATNLPQAIKCLMKLHSKIMTSVAYFI